MLTVINLGMTNEGRDRLSDILKEQLRGLEHDEAAGVAGFEEKLKGESLDRIVLAVRIPANGVCLECHQMRGFLIDHPGCLKGCIGGIIIDGMGELFTKSVARQLAFAMDLAGCTLPGRALVEATGTLYNFNTISKVNGVDNMTAYGKSVGVLIHKVNDFKMPKVEHPNILVVHASSRSTSNSILLWDMIKKDLGDRADITEISLRNGAVIDCRGCSYETCLHYGEHGDCLYGGVMVEQVYPAILKCDTLVMVCPNYNDAVSANITAFINRLTALFRSNDFSRKRVFALVVSGYSGSDIVSGQVIGAMSFNKNFILQGGGIMTETANDPRSILECEGIEGRAEEFAGRLLGQL